MNSIGSYLIGQFMCFSIVLFSDILFFWFLKTWWLEIWFFTQIVNKPTLSFDYHKIVILYFMKNKICVMYLVVFLSLFTCSKNGVMYVDKLYFMLTLQCFFSKLERFINFSWLVPSYSIFIFSRCLVGGIRRFNP